MLTIDKNVDFIILNNLNDNDLINFCQTSSQANKTCNDQDFWFSRIIKKYSQYLSMDMINKYKKDKWSDYYIELGEKTKKYPSYNLAKAMEENRQDLQTILKIKYPNINIIHLKSDDAEFYYDKNLPSFVPIPQGKYKTFYPDGKIRIEGNYLDGIKIGEWKSYYQNGKLNSVNNYKKNNQGEILNGEQIRYNDDGSVNIYEIWKNNAMIERKFM